MKKKTLIIVGHPNIEQSIINKRWIEELQKHQDIFTVHNIAEYYPDEKINVEKEQQLIEAHEKLVWQYPFYNINSPAILKKWIENVITFGWAFGPNGNKLENKSFALAISTGAKKNDFQLNGKYQASFEDLILPFKTIALHTKMNYKGYFALHDSRNISEKALETNSQEYVHFIMNL